MSGVARPWWYDILASAASTGGTDHTPNSVSDSGPGPASER